MEEASGARGAENADERRTLTFLLGSDWYAVPLEALEEVLDPPELTQVPSSPSHVLGVAGLRGEVVAVVDLRRLFGLPADAPSEKARILLVGDRSERVGLRVDEVGKVVRSSPEEIGPPPEGAHDLIEGCVPLDETAGARLLEVGELLALLRES